MSLISDLVLVLNRIV